MCSKQYNIAIGLLRPSYVFFFDLDGYGYRKLKKLALKHLKYFSLYKTKHGYHVIGYPFSRRIWRIFKNALKTDYTMKLRMRWYKVRKAMRKNWNPSKEMIIRISFKYDALGNIVNRKPKKIFGNFELLNVEKYKVMYWCK